MKVSQRADDNVFIFDSFRVPTVFSCLGAIHEKPIEMH